MQGKNKIRAAFLFVLLGIHTLTALAEQSQQNQLAEVNEQLETWQMSLLARMQRSTDVTIKAFATDGCSGGMSDGWHFIAGTIPAVAGKIGNKPPWENCCIEHDRAYWRGETEDGFNKRLQADKRLEQCVIEFGRQHAEEYADRYSLDVATIEKNFTIAAGLMYRAVRVGGKPCSFLPWRWGYGWPHCLPDITVTDD